LTPQKAEEVSGVEKSIVRSRLRRYLRDLFDESELRDLCFDLEIDFDGLQGEGKGDKVRELLAYVERRGRTNELLELCRRLRPNVSW